MATVYLAQDLKPLSPTRGVLCAARGVFRTTDGGATWQHVLFVDESTGCSDLAMDPSNPRVLFAGTWQLEIHTWGRTSGGPGGGLHVSRDGGETWTRLSDSGLPTGSHDFGRAPVPAARPVPLPPDHAAGGAVR